MSTENPLSSIPAESISTNPADRVIRYHIQTKHHFNRYSRSLGYLDWANQPDPFRRFEGSQLIPLPLLKPDEEPLSPAYDAIYQHGAVACQSFNVRTLSRFFEFTLALSAWKKAGESEWALRSNPSSGNLHPTEGYLVLPKSDGLDLRPGLYHYAPKEHGLEFRADFPAEQVALLMAPFPLGAFLFGLTSVHWREAWKYGERAFRYCNHDVGHAIGTARIAAATLGWNMALLDGAEQNTIALLLGTNRADDFADVEPEHPDCLAVVWPLRDVRGEESGVRGKGLGVGSTKARVPFFLDAALVKNLSNASWHGKANRLSYDHGVHWDIIDDAAEASWKTQADKLTVSLGTALYPAPPHPLPLTPHEPLAGQIIRDRKSTRLNSSHIQKSRMPSSA